MKSPFKQGNANIKTMVENKFERNDVRTCSATCSCQIQFIADRTLAAVSSRVVAQQAKVAARLRLAGIVN